MTGLPSRDRKEAEVCNPLVTAQKRSLRVAARIGPTRHLSRDKALEPFCDTIIDVAIPNVGHGRARAKIAMDAVQLDMVDSTNDEAKRQILRRDIRKPFYVLAREQSAGRGSRGRAWSSPANVGVYLSVVEFPNHSPADSTTAYTLAAGVACAETLRKSTGCSVQLKPVNDLLLCGGKLGGILTETVVQRGAVEAVIVGVGINTHRANRRVQLGALTPVTLEGAMSTERFANLDLNSMVATLILKIHAWCKCVSMRDMDRITRAWQDFAIDGASLPMVRQVRKPRNACSAELSR